MNRIWLVFFGDFVSFWVSFFIIIDIRFGCLFSSAALKTHLIPFTILFVSWVLIFYLFGLYDLFKIKPTLPNLKHFGLALSVCFVIGIFFFYFIQIFGISPKTNLLFQVVGFGLLSFLFRRLIYVIFSSQITRPAILVGETKYISELKIIIENNPQMGLKVAAHTTDLEKALREYSDMKNSVFIFESIMNEIPKRDILSLYQNNTEIIDVAKAYEQYLAKIPIGYVSQAWIIENISTKGNLLYDSFTRVFDIVFAVITLALASPFLLISAFFIYMYDRGPIFYIHDRVGLNGKIFKLYKLRSMVVNSETKGIVWANLDDSRITPVGKIIRKIHLDEVPQMLNILKGDLTVVGPRPERPEFVKLLEQSIPYYEFRHIVRPGFTGWAQIKYRYARSVEDSREKFKYDLYYIKNRNIFLDFGIVLKTMQIIFMY